MQELFCMVFVMISFLLPDICIQKKKQGPAIKNAAQGLFTFATYGVGMFIGTWFSGFVVDNYKTPEGHNWTKIWFCAGLYCAGQF